MNRTFVLPAAIALAFHALLFVGSGKPPTKPDGRQPVILTDDPPPVDVDDPLPVTTDDDFVGDRKDIEGPPRIIEPPPCIYPKGPVFTQKYVYVKPGTATKLTPFNMGPQSDSIRGEKLFTPDLLDGKPRVRFQKEPLYPPEMKNTGVTGTVWVEFVVDENGRVHHVRVVKSTNPGFDDTTLAAVAQWRFEPGKHKGAPVRFRMTIPIVFSLNE